jgi:hypothetical protein
MLQLLLVLIRLFYLVATSPCRVFFLSLGASGAPAASSQGFQHGPLQSLVLGGSRPLLLLLLLLLTAHPNTVIKRRRH